MKVLIVVAACLGIASASKLYFRNVIRPLKVENYLKWFKGDH